MLCTEEPCPGKIIFSMFNSLDVLDHSERLKNKTNIYNYGSNHCMVYLSILMLKKTFCCIYIIPAGTSEDPAI